MSISVPFVLLRDPLDHCVVDEARDDVSQRRGVGHRVVCHGSNETSLTENVSGTRVGVDLFELYVVLGAQISERGGKRSCTDASDESKLRTVAASAPAIQKSCTESSIVTAARYGKKISGRQFAMVGSECSFVGLDTEGCHTLPVCVGIKPRIRYIDVDLRRHCKWNGRQAIGARTPDEEKVECEHKNQGERNAADATSPPKHPREPFRHLGQRPRLHLGDQTMDFAAN